MPNTATPRDDIAREWAAHLDHCEDPTCATCAAFDIAFHGTTTR